MDIEAEAYIDGAYISDPMHKIEIYQRIAAIRQNGEIRELLDELIDRFGEPTPVCLRLLDIARIRNLARDIGVRSIVEKPLFLELSFIDKPEFDTDGLLKLLQLFGAHAKMLAPPQRILRIRLAPQYKKSITNFVTRVLLMLKGDKEAFAAKGKTEKGRAKAVGRRA